MFSTQTTSDEAVLAPAFDYVEGWYAGDAERVTRAAHPELSKRFMRTIAPGRSYLEECGASKLIALAASGAGSALPAEHRTCEASIIDRSDWAPRGPDMAVVKVVGATGTEYLQQAMLAGGWRIINILGEPRAEAPFRFAPCGVVEPPVDEAQNGPDDDATIIEMANGYLTGWFTGDRTLLARHLHPSLSKKSLREDKEGLLFLDNFNYPKYTTWTGYWLDGGGATDASAARSDITVLDRTSETAALRIDYNFDEQGMPQSLEYVDGAKVDGRWLVVDILWGSDRVSDEGWRTLYW